MLIPDQHSAACAASENNIRTDFIDLVKKSKYDINRANVEQNPEEHKTQMMRLFRALACGWS